MLRGASFTGRGHGERTIGLVWDVGMGGWGHFSRRAVAASASLGGKGVDGKKDRAGVSMSYCTLFGPFRKATLMPASTGASIAVSIQPQIWIDTQTNR